MAITPRHARNRVHGSTSKSIKIAVAFFATVLLALGGGSASTATEPKPSVKNFDYGVTCTEAWLYPGRELTNGDHINMDVIIDGVKEQRNAYVDQDVTGGYEGLGVRINGFDPIPLTEDQVKTGAFRFSYSDYITADSFTVEWVQFNSSYFNQDRNPDKFIECGGTPPPPEMCVPEYEWEKKAEEYKYEHRVDVFKDQVRFKKQERVRTWKPGNEEVEEYRTQTRAWLKPSEHKQVKTTWRFGGSGSTTINGVVVPGKWSNNGGGASWYELPSAVTNAVWGPSGPPASIVPPSSSESNPSTGSVSLSTYGAPNGAGNVQYRAWLVPEGEWSGWSAWSGWSSANPGPATDTMRVDSRTTQEATPGSWGDWSGWSWATPHKVTDWLDAPVAEFDIPSGPWVAGVPKFVGADESKQYQFIEYGTQKVVDRVDVSGPEWYEEGEQPTGWTLVNPKESRQVVVDGPVWSSEKPGEGWEKTGEERKTDCLVTPPSYTPGNCLAPGSGDAPETDTYAWEISGPADARTYTAVPKGNNILTGQLVFGPYDMTQTNWNADECQPTFEVEQKCGYVSITYNNDSKWDRWPDYSFTGDTKESTDYGSGPVWNTVEVPSGESVVLFEKYFDEDYADGGPIEVWFQDILGAERDIDTTKVTLTVETDCEANEVQPVLPEVTPQVCAVGDQGAPSFTGGSIALPVNGLDYSVWGEDDQVTDLNDLAPGTYTVKAQIVAEHEVFSAALSGWVVSEDGLNAETTIVVEEAEDCAIDRPEAPDPTFSEWAASSYACGDTTVTESRGRTDRTPVWEVDQWVWVETDTSDSQVRDLTEEELAQFGENCGKVPPPDEPKGDEDEEFTRVLSATGFELGAWIGVAAFVMIVGTLLVAIALYARRRDELIG